MSGRRKFLMIMGAIIILVFTTAQFLDAGARRKTVRKGKRADFKFYIDNQTPHWLNIKWELKHALPVNDTSGISGDPSWNETAEECYHPKSNWRQPVSPYFFYGRQWYYDSATVAKVKITATEGKCLKYGGKAVRSAEWIFKGDQLTQHHRKVWK
jgi:hypothetical protein